MPPFGAQRTAGSRSSEQPRSRYQDFKLLLLSRCWLRQLWLAEMRLSGCAPTCENRPFNMSTTHASAITPAIIDEHGISPPEYEKIKDALGREPSLTELGIFSVMWSEHCSYKSSRVHLKRLPTRSRRVVQG